MNGVVQIPLALPDEPPHDCQRKDAPTASRWHIQVLVTGSTPRHASQFARRSLSGKHSARNQRAPTYATSALECMERACVQQSEAQARTAPAKATATTQMPLLCGE
eukprot:4981465-Alexandrium_andersonii.AAC.1